jgi:D-3-phosphoglycerate dehydrogenase
MTRVFLTHNRSALNNYYGQRAFDELSQLAQVTFHDSDNETTEADIIRLASDCEILVSFRIPPISAQLISSLPNLAAICRVAVDIRNIDVNYASQNGILVTRASPGFGPSVGEWVLGAMINLARHMGSALRSYQQGLVPAAVMGRELRGANLGIVGYGTIGKYLARLGCALGMKVIVTDPHTDAGDEPGITQATLGETLAQSDFVICLAPAIPETANLFNLSAFQQMKRSAYFINASRAELVDESALLQALDTGLIAGCALDVGSARDQTPPLALATHPKVLATPHVGGLTPEAAEHQAMDSVQQVQALLQGELPKGCVNAAHATRAHKLFGIELPVN